MPCCDDEKCRSERYRAADLFRRVIENCDDDKTKADAIEGIVQCLPQSEALQYAEMYPQAEIDPSRREELIISCLTGEERINRRERQLMKKLEALTDYLDIDVKAERDVFKKLIDLFFPDGNYLLFNYKMYSASYVDARDKINEGKLDEAAESAVYITDAEAGQIRMIVDSAYVMTGEFTGSESDTCLYSGQKNLVSVMKEALKNKITLLNMEDTTL